MQSIARTLDTVIEDFVNGPAYPDLISDAARLVASLERELANSR